MIGNFSGTTAANVTIRAGSKSHRVGGTVVQVSEIVNPDEYDSEVYDYDFSLLQLAEPLNFTNKVQSVALPNATYTVEDDESCQVSGWGNALCQWSLKNLWELIENVTCFISGNQTILRPLKDLSQSSIVRIVNNTACQEDYESIYTITDRMICANSTRGPQGQDGPQGPGFGGQGGPGFGFGFGGQGDRRGPGGFGGPGFGAKLAEGSSLVCGGLNGNGTLVGVRSFTESLGPKYPGVYGRVQSVLSWIQTTTGI